MVPCLMEPDVLDRLADYRLEHNLTFGQLADKMRAAGYAVGTLALHRALTKKLRTKPRDRTMFRYRRFLEHLEAADERRRRRQGAR